MTTAKTELRKWVALQKSHNASPTWQAYYSAKIMKTVESHPAFKAAQTVLLYYSLNDEVDTRGFIQRWYKSKQIILPVVTDDDLELRVYTGPDSLLTGRFGIQEPTGTAFTDYETIEVAIIPGVAFDRMGNRLGRGKGYYDRLLPRLPKSYKIGICYNFQLVDEVPTDRFDIRMNEIITYIK